MNPGGLAQMSSTNFASHNGFGNSGGLASRRGGQNIKPLSFDGVAKAVDKENTVPTPRTSRSHLLAGLRTAPKSATTGSFGLSSPNPTQQYARNNMAANVHSITQDTAYNAPKTAFPQYAGQQQQQQRLQHQPLQHQQQQQQQPMHMNNAHLMSQQYTVDQVLAPPELSFDDQVQEQMDPGLYAQLVATNMYLAQQQQRLQQQLRTVQAAAQQFQQLNLSNPQLVQQQMAIYEQQNQLRTMQQQLGVQAAATQAPQQQFYYNPMTGQYYVDTMATSQMATPSYTEQQPMTPGSFGGLQQQHNQQQHSQQQQQQQMYQGHTQSQSQSQTPRVQVSPPPETLSQGNGRRSSSPSKRGDSPQETQPLPPPSANAFRRGHKKASSLAPVNSSLASGNSSTVPPSAGPKSAFPITPMTGGYGPGQGRAGEHPIRQPRGPPSMDELKLKPTAKYEGSKNFAARTRRSAVHNLVRAGLERRKGTGSSAGSMSPVSETEESTTPITDNDSESGRSGSGSLAGEEENLPPRKPVGGGWGAIGSDRPNSSQRARTSSDDEAESNSFAHVFKNGALRASKAEEAAEGQRRAPRLVLTNSDKRRTAAPMA
ncbi:hypothetical protein GMORB2_3496 [Geosmithia morbida]|uniref:Uncharacterized protein n=1 Tax=Geosmithia morbida TaxID=1094350 RepID=A0A9P4YQC7_9HYPO|nr:uncharacterized protein GMORB2_3496 [Geosmithia morbida]KAF4120085.1 hypothetical protein GMORB2_3496 [Geosmithia morbida]